MHVEKNMELDNFTRDWPKIIVSDKETISRVDNDWGNYGIGPFIV